MSHQENGDGLIAIFTKKVKNKTLDYNDNIWSWITSKTLLNYHRGTNFICQQKMGEVYLLKEVDLEVRF